VFGDDLVLAVANQREIEAGVLAVDSFFDRVLEMIPNVRGMKESFGGNAAYVEAAAA
jgi:hypothetical protein